jgi:hypothetical protein
MAEPADCLGVRLHHGRLCPGGLLTAVGIMWWVTNGRFDIDFGLGYAVIVSVAISTGSAISRQRRRNRKN